MLLSPDTARPRFIISGASSTSRTFIVTMMVSLARDGVGGRNRDGVGVLRLVVQIRSCFHTYLADNTVIFFGGVDGERTSVRPAQLVGQDVRASCWCSCALFVRGRNRVV